MILNDEESKALGPIGYYCPKCGKEVIKRYCGYCDEFYNVCDCTPAAGSRDDHEVCTYMRFR